MACSSKRPNNQDQLEKAFRQQKLNQKHLNFLERVKVKYGAFHAEKELSLGKVINYSRMLLFMSNEKVTFER